MSQNKTMNYEAKKWLDVWKMIDNFDRRHEKINCPYQEMEIDQIISDVQAAVKSTKTIPFVYELDFYQIESLINTMIKTREEKPVDMKINQLKDTIHRLYIKLEKET